MKWEWRKIRWKLLFGAGLVYRVSVITLNTIFLWFWNGETVQNNLLPDLGKWGVAIGTALPWAVINMAWYYTFHGVLLKTHRFAK